MFNIILYEPEIPPNTGNIIRLCANTGSALHLIHPLGFAPNDKQLQRAGLDYHDWAKVKHYDNYEIFLSEHADARIYACSTHGKTSYTENKYHKNDFFLFGPETRGLPKELLIKMPPRQVIKIPMVATSRSLNLSNAAAVIVYEAWRQLNFITNE